MSYEACEAGLINQLKQIDGFDDSNVSLADWTIINTGINIGAVVQYRSFIRNNFTGDGPTSTLWNVAIYLVVRYTDDVAVYEAMRSNRQAILDRIQRYPDLEIPLTVFNAEIIEGEMQGLPDSIDEPFMVEVFTCQIQENSQLRIA